jgi:galactose mutarotase-like enzyme
MEARIMTYGGIIVSLKVPDKNGNFGDVVLGYDKLDDYVKNNPFFGALVGRYGNRIAKGKFTLDGRNTRWLSIMRPTTCTAAQSALIKGCGKRPRS